MAEPVRIKICGLVRRDDVLEADRLGADYLGVILSPGFGRSVPVDQAAKLVASVAAAPVAVTVDEDVERNVEIARAVGAAVIQLHGDEPPEVSRALREAGPWQVWKAVRAPDRARAHAAAEAYGAHCDGLLVEGYRPGVTGGGGVRADGEAVLAARDALPADVALILAGGLNPSNVADSITRFRPDVVDVSSGVEADLGRKDHDLLRGFIRAARQAPIRGRTRSTE